MEPKPCPKCGQVDHGQFGEYPCPTCGLPTMHDEPTCDYFGCGKPLAPDQPETGMKFCAEHDAQLTAIAQEIAAGGNVGKLFKFWIDAQGGPQRAAERMMKDSD